jgi:tartrate-resistant acid phosphatase type 5
MMDRPRRQEAQPLVEEVERVEIGGKGFSMGNDGLAIWTMAIHALAMRSFRALLISAAIAAPASAAAQTKFAAFGDIGNTSSSAAVANLTRSRGAQFILMLGDICYGSQAFATQVNANYKVERAGGDLWPALGNHEFTDACGGGSTAPAYRSYFTLPNNERYYSFKSGPVEFFAISSYKDADGVSATSKQATWLKTRLLASTSPWQIVYFHHPPYSSGQHGGTTHMRWPFEAWGADAVLSGHDHDYERIMRDVNGDGLKIPYFVSGLGGKSRRSFGTVTDGSVKRYSSAFGALFITATSTSLQFEFRNTSGTLIDNFTKTKSTSASAITALAIESRGSSAEPQTAPQSVESGQVATQPLPDAIAPPTSKGATMTAGDEELALDAMAADPEHHKILMENDQVRVLDTRVLPGERTPVHSHRWPATLYVMSWSDFLRRDANEKIIVDSRNWDRRPVPGEALWLPPLTAHSIENIGQSELHLIAVEVKSR